MSRGGGPKPKKPDLKLKVPGKAPVCPDWLDEEAKSQWSIVAAQLEEMGIAHLADASALATYCDMWSRWKQATASLRKNGSTYTTEKGWVIQRPEVAIARTLVSLMNKYQQQFGLTPASRAVLKVGAVAEKQVDELEEFVNRRKKKQA